MRVFKYIGVAFLMLAIVSPAGAGDFGKADRLICAAVGANDGLVSTVSLSHLAD